MAPGLNEGGERQFGNEGQRTVLLVTTPVGESFQSIARATGCKLPRYPRVDWSSRANTALPDIASRIRFTTHYALCVIDRNIWESISMTLLEKFRRAKFWDHPGDCTMMASSTSSKSDSSMIPAHMNACMVWCDEKIGNIESGDEIGLTNSTDEEITKVYRELREDWTYMPIYWNCHDLAIRLAHIIIEPSMEVIMSLKTLVILLRRACNEEVNLASTVGSLCIGGWGAALVGGLATVPPLAVAGVSVFMVGWSVGFVGGFVQTLKWRARYQFMVKLEERFPRLLLLHH